ncbi:hypothetical protein [Amycolatopsis sp. lyj-90]|uniref:hypothetical protein n=1 Tax=Amycolatopsis sp. lyj-90 TaxID=2789285 RepID=UPI00397C4052
MTASAHGREMFTAADHGDGTPHRASPTLASAAEYYRENFGWTVETQERKLVLRLTGGLAAVSMPFKTAQLLLQTAGALPDGPLLVLPGAPFQVYALVESDDVIVLKNELPEGIRYHSPPSMALLPPTVLPRGAVTWLRAPSREDRWLPLASGVLSTISRPWVYSKGPRR